VTNRPKAIGTAGETAVVRYARTDGFPGAERLALHGTLDEGDAAFCPGVGAEVKAGKAAENASDAQISAWLAEAEAERINRRADVMLLVLKRKGKGAANAASWWAHLPGWTFVYLARSAMNTSGAHYPIAFFAPFHAAVRTGLPAVRITLAEACQLLRAAGYGDRLP